MPTVIPIVAPVFALVLLGFGLRRSGVLPQRIGQVIAKFAFNVAIPALLFRTSLNASLPDADPLSLWGAYYGAVALTWLLAVLASRVLANGDSADGAALTVAAVYGNTVMLGIPLCVAAFGEGATVPAAVILSVHAPILLGTASLHMALATRKQGATLAASAAALGYDLVRNPLVIAVVGGSLLRLAGVTLPDTLDTVLALLARASVPLSLFALGVSLAAFSVSGALGPVSSVLALKLVVMPLAAFVLAERVFGLGAVDAGVVAIFAGCPAGINAFVLASQRERVAPTASGAVVLGTAASALTVTLLLAYLEAQPF